MPKNVDTILDELESAHGNNFGFIMSGGRPVHVRINHAKLTDIPNDCCKLTSLQVLDVANNRIGKITKSIGLLSRLKTLDLKNNRLKTFPKSVTAIKSLTSLILSLNKIGSISPSIARLSNLNYLNLSDNELSNLPDEIGHLHKMTKLSLSNNRLENLPASLASLRNLASIDLDGNPLSAPILELHRRGIKPLMVYLKSICDGLPQYEARMIVIGEGNVGKSCLVDSLLGKKFVEGKETTHGIQLGTVRINHYDSTIDQPIVLNTWDFGGQEIYRITNQFFYTNRSIYLLVWRPREGAEENSVEGWLERIRLRVAHNDAKIIIVSTYRGERRADIDTTGIIARHGSMIAGFCSINNKTGEGVDELKQKIAQATASLPHMGHLMNKDWIAARDEVCGRKVTHLSRKEFNQICSAHGLNPVAAATLADLLHDLGRFIHYSDKEGLQDLIVLQPEWLTQAISFVSEDQATADAKGVLDHDRLRNLWNDQNRPAIERYPAKLHPYFLKLMEQFDISFRYDDLKTSLIGQMVPYERPAVPAIDLNSRYLTSIYEFDQTAPGLIPWLIVRTSRFSSNTHWRRGMVLHHQGHHAVIELDARKPRLQLSVWGPSPDFFFHLLTDTIDQVVSRWTGLAWSQMVPCREDSCLKSPSPGYFGMKTLTNARDQRRTTVQCHACLADCDLSELLTGFELPKSLILDEIRLAISKFGNKLDSISVDTRRINEALQIMRRIHKAITSELRDAPGLVTFWPSDSRKWLGKIDPRNIGIEEYDLWLWCDHLDCPHPVKKYTVKRPKEWLVTIAPYANLVANTLKIALPIAGAAVNFLLPAELSGNLDKQIESMRKIADLVKGDLEIGTENNVASSGLSYAEGAGARSLHHLLNLKDEIQDWGGLRQCQTPAGDIHWVCSAHHKEYDPELPVLSYLNPKAENGL